MSKGDLNTSLGVFLKREEICSPCQKFLLQRHGGRNASAAAARSRNDLLRQLSAAVV